MRKLSTNRALINICNGTFVGLLSAIIIIPWPVAVIITFIFQTIVICYYISPGSNPHSSILFDVIYGIMRAFRGPKSYRSVMPYAMELNLQCSLRKV